MILDKILAFLLVKGNATNGNSLSNTNIRDQNSHR